MQKYFNGNNCSSPQSITNGMILEGLLSRKLFNTGVLNSKGYAEFVTANLNPGMGVQLQQRHTISQTD